MSEHETTLRELAQWSELFTSRETSACLAGADALQRETRCCGNCKHVQKSPPIAGLPALYLCRNPKAPASRASEVQVDDCCRLGWEAHEAAHAGAENAISGRHGAT